MLGFLSLAFHEQCPKSCCLLATSQRPDITKTVGIDFLEEVAPKVAQSRFPRILHPGPLPQRCQNLHDHFWRLRTHAHKILL